MTDKDHDEWLKDELAREKLAAAGRKRYVHKPEEPEDDDEEDTEEEAALEV